MVTPIEVILEAGSQATGVTVRQLKSPRRFRLFARARAFIAKKMRAEGYSLNQIGRQLGGRDHATIMHYLGRTRASRQVTP